ncbi:DUF4236 domain-containing protein [Weissella confusa]|uniref:DUF4236 domain-containing protein n=1 Tax=Weissella confusa TaxID=1583 RepID=UPI0022E14513|nr:DUF4236 domain-containing protein [Weissella confusa]
MGMRYRKSIKAGPFRINLSKSGMGWSVGGKGYRYTKTANGRTRTTTSIPGTGISWVKESKGKSSVPSKTLTPVESPVSYQHWPKKYQWHMKWLAITFVPMIILLIVIPVVMILPVLGWIVWALVTLVRMGIYQVTHRSEFKKVDTMDK